MVPAAWEFTQSPGECHASSSPLQAFFQITGRRFQFTSTGGTEDKFGEACVNLNQRRRVPNAMRMAEGAAASGGLGEPPSFPPAAIRRCPCFLALGWADKGSSQQGGFVARAVGQRISLACLGPYLTPSLCALLPKINDLLYDVCLQSL